MARFHLPTGLPLRRNTRPIAPRYYGGMLGKSWGVLDSHTVRAEDGSEFDVIQAIGQLPWVDQTCPLMPHQYAVLFKSPDLAWRVLDAMVRWNPLSYRAYFRGYSTPNRYWEAPDGLRYWRTGMMLNRCTPESVEPPRRVDQDAKPIRNWEGPPWAPNGSGIYFAVGKECWPTDEALANGFQPCRACQRRPASLKKPPGPTG